MTLADALALWRGPALADFEYGSFAREETGRLASCASTASAADPGGTRWGRPTEVVGELEALVTEEPLRERCRSLLMLALYRSGRQADALALYRETG